MSTPIVRTATESRKSVAAWRRQGMKVAVVSTMGALA
ncbi:MULTISPECIES: pantoate--beta-alanine ligase [Mesorhizobium]